jgi:hypothetical protein
MGQSATLTRSQSDALDAYNKTVQDFRSVLSERRAQINSKQKLPERPGQALYLARVAMMSAYKDLTDALPSRIGRPNKFGIPPAYFDADNEPLIDEYRNLFAIMHAAPANAQKSDTPFKDVVDLGNAIARIKGLDAAHAEVAGRISLAIFFAETGGNQNIGNARSNTYKGSFQTGVPEDKNGRKKWAAIKKSVAALAPELNARDDREEARVGNSDQRYNHWTAVRNGLMNAHADLFPKIPGNHESLAEPDRSNEIFSAHPDHSQSGQIRAQLRRLAELQDFRTAYHGILAQQQHVCLWQDRSSENICNHARNFGFDVALQRFVGASADQI